MRPRTYPWFLQDPLHVPGRDRRPELFIAWGRRANKSVAPDLSAERSILAGPQLSVANGIEMQKNLG